MRTLRLLRNSSCCVAVATATPAELVPAASVGVQSPSDAAARGSRPTKHQMLQDAGRHRWHHAPPATPSGAVANSICISALRQGRSIVQTRNSHQRLMSMFTVTMLAGYWDMGFMDSLDSRVPQKE